MPSDYSCTFLGVLWTLPHDGKSAIATDYTIGYISVISRTHFTPNNTHDSIYNHDQRPHFAPSYIKEMVKVNIFFWIGNKSFEKSSHVCMLIYIWKHLFKKRAKESHLEGQVRCQTKPSFHSDGKFVSLYISHKKIFVLLNTGIYLYVFVCICIFIRWTLAVAYCPHTCLGCAARGKSAHLERCSSWGKHTPYNIL